MYIVLISVPQTRTLNNEQIKDVLAKSDFNKRICSSTLSRIKRNIAFR